MSQTGRPWVLYLVHRIPYPPNKGDKIRSHHLLRSLSRDFRILLGTFVDDPEDLAHRAAIEPFVEQSLVLPIDPRWRRLSSLAGLFLREPMSVRYYRDGRMQAWVDEMRGRYPIEAVVCFSSSMAQYADQPAFASTTRIADFVDVDSQKWRQYASRTRWPAALLYRLEADRLLAYETRIARTFSHTTLVSEQEVHLFARLAPEAGARVSAVGNGVDAEYFDPAISHASPFSTGAEPIVFTGAMDYQPNVDAVVWFAGEVMPRVARVRPAAEFWIVGSRPVKAVADLDNGTSIRVTGTVPDVRPYLAHCRVAVAPLRIARGIQNKVLEALSMARRVVVTPQAAEGLDVESLLDWSIVAEPAGFAEAACRSFDEPAFDRGREHVLSRFSWDKRIGPLTSLIAERIRR